MTQDTEDGHRQAEEWLEEQMEWPKYYVSGENVEDEDFVPAYYRVDGPNGPVSYVNPGSEEPIPTTMHDFAMEARADDFHLCEREETPWPVHEDTEE